MAEWGSAPVERGFWIERGTIDYLEEAAERCMDLSVPLEKIVKRMQEDTFRNFDSEGTESGRPWPSLAESTVRKRGGSSGPMGIGRDGYQDGLLRQAIFRRVDGRSWYCAVVATAPHAHLFAYGTKRHSIGGRRVNAKRLVGNNRSAERFAARGITSQNHQPPRPFLFHSEQNKEQAVHDVGDYILENK